MNLHIENLNVSYDQDILKSLNLDVKEGEFCSLIGHSGTGKSTILKSIAGLVDMKVDKMMLGGKDIGHVPSHKREIGYVFQKPLLFPHLTVYKNISYSLEIRSWSKNRIDMRVKELLQLLDLVGYDQRMPDELSGGQQQRIAIGRALAFQPKILLMDEPFSSLDPILRKQMGDFLKMLQNKLSLTILFVTHDANEALRLSDHIAFVDEGRIVQYDEPSRIYEKPISKKIGDFFGISNWLDDKAAQQLERIIPEKALLFIRPHHIQLEKQGDWQVTKKQVIGNQVICKIQKNDIELTVESMKDLWEIGSKVSITIVTDHIIKEKS